MFFWNQLTWKKKYAKKPHVDKWNQIMMTYCQWTRWEVQIFSVSNEMVSKNNDFYSLILWIFVILSMFWDMFSVKLNAYSTLKSLNGVINFDVINHVSNFDDVYFILPKFNSIHDMINDRSIGVLGKFWKAMERCCPVVFRISSNLPIIQYVKNVAIVESRNDNIGVIIIFHSRILILFQNSFFYQK